MKVSFEEFWDKLVEDELWWDRIKIQFARKDLREIGNSTYDYLLTVPNRLAAGDAGDWRQLFRKNCVWAKDKPYGPTLQQVEVKEDKIQAPPLTGAERLARIKEWEALVRKVEPVKPVGKLTYKEISDEGDWLPKKPAPYPKTNAHEVKKQALHLAYIKANYEPRTAEKLIGWAEEDLWIQSLTEEEVIDIVKEFLKLK